MIIKKFNQQKQAIFITNSDFQ